LHSTVRSRWEASTSGTASAVKDISSIPPGARPRIEDALRRTFRARPWADVLVDRVLRRE